MDQPRRMHLSLHRFEWCDLLDELYGKREWIQVCKQIEEGCNAMPAEQEVITLSPLMATVLKVLESLPQSPLRISIQHQSHVSLLSGE